ncbi:hypothetical protein [Brachybacterium kimchii]|uniref:Uncharacterized protein n=1 Tax=Brachybacterium kimchii TaxID=2942909 RepID=A0ABY4NB52_9MICO|nr:hypothetical protein [Brachybacterium kimchii]UQN31785.1 hypothetical protein M4486_19540 [Brachybacterium kimchii]
MTRSNPPKVPTRVFEVWRDAFESHRDRHAPTGRHFRVTRAYQQQLYYAHGGLDAAVTVGDLEWVSRVEARIAESQRIVWDAHAREVLAAIEEGGWEGTAEALRESEEWLHRLRRDGQVVDEGSDAARWIDGVLSTCPPNPLIRAEEVWGLWEAVAGARAISIHLRDQLILELDAAGEARTRIARALGWSYGRFQRHLRALEERRLGLDLRARAGLIPGVMPLESQRSS